MGRKFRLPACLVVGASLVLAALFPVPLAATEPAEPPGIVTVTTAAALKSAFENPDGGHVKLGANIRIPSGMGEFYIEVPHGTFTLDLNGFALEYFYLNRANEYDGVPIRVQGKLTVNGPGAITGGYVALECSGWDSMLVVNGGTMTGKAASAIRSGGLTVINGGTLVGRFGDVWHENGLLVDNAGIVKRIDNNLARNPSTIRGGVLKGTAELHRHLVLPSLAIPEGSQLTVRQSGILDVSGSLTGKERILYNKGFLIHQGNATLSGQLFLSEPLSLRTLTLVPTAEVMIVDRGRITIQETLLNQGSLRVDTGTTLTVNGNLTNTGTLHVEDKGALTVKGTLKNTGTFHSPDLDSPASTTSPRMQEAAHHLHALGLFQGTGTLPDGGPDFALTVAPTRLVSLVMLVRLLGKEKAALEGVWSHPFTDVPAWANAHVGYAYQNGLTQGVSETRFGSANLATPFQYLTFVLRALGYSDKDGDFSWRDPTTLSKSVGLIQDGYTDNAMTFFRGDVAILSEQALALKIKGSQATLLQQLHASGAVTLEQVQAAGLDNLLEPPSSVVPQVPEP